MTTEFGKMLRKLRIDCDENIRDMAFNLDITASYLSAIECGKRNIPKNLVDKVAKVVIEADNGTNRSGKTKC